LLEEIVQSLCRVIEADNGKDRENFAEHEGLSPRPSRRSNGPGDELRLSRRSPKPKETPWPGPSWSG